MLPQARGVSNQENTHSVHYVTAYQLGPGNKVLEQRSTSGGDNLHWSNESIAGSTKSIDTLKFKE